MSDAPEVDLGAQYRAAKAAVTEHLARWSDACQAKAAWLRAHRHLPAHVLFDRDTGEPLDPELRELHDDVSEAEAAYWWCRALVVAVGELIKGKPFEEVLAEQQRHRTPDEIVSVFDELEV